MKNARVLELSFEGEFYKVQARTGAIEVEGIGSYTGQFKMLGGIDKHTCRSRNFRHSRRCMACRLIAKQFAILNAALALAAENGIRIK